MAKTYTQLTANDTFGGWLQRTNDLSDDMTNVVLTVAPVNQPNTTNGGQATGNTHVEGYFSASHVSVPNDLKGGTLTNPATLKIASNVSFEANLISTDSNTVFQTNSNVEIRGATKKLTVSTQTTHITSANVTMDGAEFVANNTNISFDANNFSLVSAANTYINAEDITLEANTFVETLTNGETVVTGTYTYKGNSLVANTTAMSIASNTFVSTTNANTIFTAGHFRVDAPNMVFAGTTLADFAIPVKASNTFVANGSSSVFNNTTFDVNASNAQIDATANLDIGARTLKINANNVTLAGNGAFTATMNLVFNKDIVINANTSANNINANNLTSANGQFTDVSVANNSTLKNIYFTGGVGNIYDHMRMQNGKYLYFSSNGVITMNEAGNYLSIRNTFGRIFLDAEDDLHIRANNTVTGVLIRKEGDVTLNHNGVARLATYSTGVDILGILSADEITMQNDEQIKLGSSNYLRMHSNTVQSSIVGNTVPLAISSNNSVKIMHGVDNALVSSADGSVSIYYDGAKKLETTANGVNITNHLAANTVTTTGLLKGNTLESTGAATFNSTIQVNGNANFAANVNANTGVLTVRDLVVTGNTELNSVDITGGELDGDLRIKDNNELRIGTHNDLVLIHDGTNSYIDEKGTGSLHVRSDNYIFFKSITSNNNILRLRDVDTTVYTNGTLRSITTDDGLFVYGSLSATGLNASGGDSLILNCGDAKLYANLAIQTGDNIYLNSDSHVEITTPDNAHANWATGFVEKKTIIKGEEITIDGQTVFHDGYHPNADKLTTARTISLSGDASGSVSFDGASNADITVTVQNDSHTHDTRYYTKAEADSNYLAKTGSQTFNGQLTLSHDAPMITFADTTVDALHGRIWQNANYMAIESGNTTAGRIIFGNRNSGPLNQLLRRRASGSFEILDTSTGVSKTGDTMTGGLSVPSIDIGSYGGLTNVAGSYGSVSTSGAGKGNYAGYSVDNKAVFMASANNTGFHYGIYNDVDNQWGILNFAGGGTQLFHNGTMKLRTTSSGVEANGNVYTSTGNVYASGNNGFVGHLQTYLTNDGTDGYLKNLTRNLYVQTPDNIFMKTGGKASIYAYKNSVVQLYYNGSKRFETNGTGVSITGEVNTTEDINIPVDKHLWVGGQTFLRHYSSAAGGNSAILRNTLGDMNVDSARNVYIRANNNTIGVAVYLSGATRLNHLGSNKLETNASGVNVTGTVTADGLNMDDNQQITLSSSNYMRLLANTAASYILSYTVPLAVYSNNHIKLYHSGGKNGIVSYDSGAVVSYYDGNVKTTTTATGLNVTGAVDADSIVGDWKATQAEAEAGTVDYKVMTPLRVKQAIEELATPVQKALFAHEEPAGTTGKTIPANTWTTFDLNTTRYNDITGASLSGNKITLPAGTYEVRAYAHQFKPYYGKSRIVGDSSGTLLVGLSVFSTSGSTYGEFEVLGRFTLASTDSISHEMICSSTNRPTGEEVATHMTNNSEVEVYGYFEVTKIA